MIRLKVLSTVLVVCLALLVIQTSVLAKDADSDTNSHGSGKGNGKPSELSLPQGTGPNENRQSGSDNSNSKPEKINETEHSSSDPAKVRIAEQEVNHLLDNLKKSDTGFVKHDLKKLAQGSILDADDEQENELEKEASQAGRINKLAKVEVHEATDSAQSKRRAIQGVVTGLNGNILTLTHQTQTSRVTQILIGDAVLVRSKSNSSGEATGSATLTLGVRVVVVGDLNSSGQLVARMIKIIPGKAKGLEGRIKISTPSATPASTSATPTFIPLTDTPTPTP